MRVNLNIEEDAEFREYVKGTVAGHVRAVLREQLAGIVAGEIAKLRLLQPDSTTLSDMVNSRVDYAVRNFLTPKNIDSMVRDAVKHAIADCVTPYVANIRASVNAAVRDAVIETLKQ